MSSVINSEFLSSLSQSGISWRWPLYQSWLMRDDFCSISKSSNSMPSRLSFLWKKLPIDLFSRFRTASYIEWRYYSILSDRFHGICGFSLFNPENHFAQLSEGGLIVIVAGGLDGAASSLQKSGTAALSPTEQTDRVKEFCFMHVFPMDSVIFYGPQRQHVRASHQGIEIKIEHLDAQSADIFIELEGGLSVNLKHRSVPGCPALAPLTGTDFKTIPGAHWTVFNPSPLSQVNGSLTIRPGLLNCSENSPGVHNPNFVSPPLANKLYNGYLRVDLENAAGYYEHSFGVNPMPLHGWDFVFAPSPALHAGLVLQTYRGSQQMSYLEVVWKDGSGEWKTLRVPQSHLDVEWTETSWHPVMRVHVPRQRVIRAHYQGYKIEVHNTVSGEIPFVRAHSPAVRHFFISEELSFTQWKLTDSSERVLVDVKDVLSGGETARGRWFYNLNGIFSMIASKPF